MAIPRSHYEIQQNEQMRKRLSRALFVAGAVAVAAFLAPGTVKNTLDNAAEKAVSLTKNSASYFEQHALRLGGFHQEGSIYKPDPLAERAFLASEDLQERVAVHIAKEFKITTKLATKIVHSSVQEAKEKNIDPLLVLGVIGAESSFKPQATSHVNAQGLMQVIPKWHPEAMREVGLSHRESVLTKQSVPTQIAVGTRVLRTYLNSNKDDVETALQHYNRGQNAKPDPTLKYAKRVLEQRQAILDKVQESLPSVDVSLDAI